MAEIIFSQRLYSDFKERRLYASLQEAFTADLKNRKDELGALCVGELRYFSDGSKDMLEYAVPQKTSVLTADFQKAKDCRDVAGKGKPVFADNMMFAGTNEDCVVVDTPSLSQACKVLLNNLNELNRISIHRMTFGTKGFSTRIEKGIQLFIEPYYFWTIDEVRENCRKEVFEEAQRYSELGYNLFGGRSSDEVVCLLGDCYILPQEVFEAWADYKAPRRSKPIPQPLQAEQYIYLDLTANSGGLLN